MPRAQMLQLLVGREDFDEVVPDEAMANNDRAIKDYCALVRVDDEWTTAECVWKSPSTKSG